MVSPGSRQLAMVASMPACPVPLTWTANPHAMLLQNKLCHMCNDHCLSTNMALALGRWHWLPPSQHAQSHSPAQQTSTQMSHPHKLCHMCNDHCWSTSMALAPGS